MKTIKVSELTGAALDWAVDKAEGHIRPDGGYYCGYHGKVTRWSTDWAQGGPIIERERISLVDVGIVNWTASISKADMYTVTQYGDTPLIATMRCYVASKLGDMVEVPKGLTYERQ
jgi:hypothetical protein